MIQTLSAKAAVTAAHERAVAGTGCRILDTRKTIPGLRLAQKYALTNRYAARIAYWENNHFQYQIGLLPEEQWEASKNSIRGQANRQAFLDTWEMERFQLRKSFADEIDGLLEEEASK